MSTFYNRNIYITEEELEKTYNFIKNEIDSKIGELKKSFEQMDKRFQEKITELEKQEIKKQLEEISVKISEIENLKKRLEEVEQIKNQINEKTNELENVANGYSDGNLTEAYAILKIYKNHFKLEEIYVGGYTLKEFLNLYNQQKIDISRFKYYNHPTLKKSDYLKYIDEDKVFLYEDFLQYTDNSDGLYLTP